MKRVVTAIAWALLVVAGTMPSAAAAPRPGGTSPTATAAARKASCTASRAAFPFPFAKTARGLRQVDFAQLTVNRGSSWAGTAYRYQDSRIYLITWRAGHRASVIASYRYVDVPFDPQYSVTPVGVTPSGAIVAAVEDPQPRDADLGVVPVKGLYWAHGRKQHLAHRHSWRSYVPTAVTSAGAVVGYAITGSTTKPHYWAVRWARANSAKPHVFADLGRVPATVTATAEGDVVWTRSDGYAYARLRDGTVHQLRLGTAASADYVSRYLYPRLAGSGAVFSSEQDGVHRWTLSGAGAGPIYGTVVTRYPGFPSAVGPRGDLVLASGRGGRLITSRGALARLPQQYLRDVGLPSRAVDAHGTVAYTSRTDRHVHLLRCR
ncbi:hypothetical protein SAMN05443575_1915 [Jatrophihabitans endophyticus]|uniref:PQQ-like domain-containing protein n=1 Tax=Jatrophihabitans endophyticus TaxID=1206085 RepID=A0A1M5IJD3_9ACTN|nr:hypothetical protein [Jatrophihabitans endophyticus]SHG28448.1 hypothetical protein SAMN05443575_1915 [Jatrophihabitans endophyticus]